jgi:hypothetical protein
MDVFTSSGEGREAQTLLGPLEIANLNHGNQFFLRDTTQSPSPADGSRSSIRNVFFTSYLEFRTMGKVLRPSDSERHTPSSEPFTFSKNTVTQEPWRTTWRLLLSGTTSLNSALQNGIRENTLRSRLNLEPALILALTKIRPRIEVLACQKQAQSSH